MRHDSDYQYDHKSFSGMVDIFCENENLNFESERGVRDLSKLANAIGYDEEQFAFGSSLERFLADNPGAQTAIVEWIADQHVPEWTECISEFIPGKDLTIDD